MNTLLRRVVRAVGGVLGVVPGWYMLCVEPIARKRTEVLEVRSSGGRYELDLSEFVQRKFYFRAYERRELRFLRSTLSAGDLVVDVGANVGLLSLGAARQVGDSGEVLAIEPAPENVERLQVNVRLNPRLRIVVLPVAIGSAPGTVRLGMPESQAEIRNSGARSRSSSENQIEVDLITIDDALQRWKPDADTVQLVKIDVEGMENDVVCGGPDLFGTKANHVMLEVNARYVDDNRAIESLQRFGYDIHRLGSFGRLLPWKTTVVPRSCISSLTDRLPAGIGSWITGETRLTTAIAIRSVSGHPSSPR